MDAANRAGDVSKDPADARRNPDSTFEELGINLAWYGRTRDVNDKLERRLRGLGDSLWHFERGFSIESTPIPFMLFGPTGAFLLQGSRGFWSDGDIAAMSRAAETLRITLRGYPDPVHCGIVVLGEQELPRQYYAGGGEGPCWILGEDLLIAWLKSFEDHGFSKADIASLRAWGSEDRVREPRRLCTPKGEG